MQPQLTTLPASYMFNATNSAVSQNTGTAPSNSAALDSRSLLRGHKAVTIVHNGASYRLQATKLGKLILTK